MNTQSRYRLIRLHLVAVICVMSCDPSEAVRQFEDAEVIWCEKHLKAILVKPLIRRAPYLLFQDNQEKATGIVFSEFKFYHELVQMYIMLRPWAQEAIREFLGLSHEKCSPHYLCRAFDNIVEDLNAGKTFDEFRYISRVYFPEKYRLKGVDVCATEYPVSAFQAGSQFTASVNQGYRDFSRTDAGYLDHDLDRRSVLQFVNSMRMASDFFGKPKLISSNNTFRDLDHNVQNMSWVKLTGEFWIHSYNPLKDDSDSRCPPVTIYRSEVVKGAFYMLYFQPDLRNETDMVVKSTCLKEIIFDIRKYIRVAIFKEGEDVLADTNTRMLAIPMIDISSDVDLKEQLENSLGRIFESQQIIGVGDTYQTLQELRTWEYFNTKPKNYYNGKLPKQDPEVVHFIGSPFVFTIVDKTTNIIMKTGAFMRP